MKILFPFLGDTVGGSHRSSSIMITSLNKEFVDPIVILHKNGKLGEFFKSIKLNFANINLPYWQSKSNSIINFFYWIYITPSLMFYLKKNKINLVHVNDSKMAITWSLACKLSSVPLIIHQRTKFKYSRITYIALTFAKKIISISKYVSASLPQKFEKKNTLIYNPFLKPKILDKNLARDKLFSKYKIPKIRKLIIVVGTLQEQKRQLFAVKVFRKINQKFKNSHLILIGRKNNNYLKKIKNLINELNLNSYITVLDYNLDIGLFYNSADMLFAPAINEGHGRVLIEAIYYNIPLVASKSGGHIEALTDYTNGYLIDPDNEFKMSEKCLQLLNNTNKITLPNLNKSLKQYNSKTHAQNILKIYRELKGTITIIIEGMGAGGTQQVVSNLINHWINRNDEVNLITFTKNSKDFFHFSNKLTRERLNIAKPSNNLIQAIYNNIIALIKLRKIIKKSTNEMIVSFLSTTNIMVLIATIGLRKKIIVCERNDIVKQKVKSKIWKILRFYAYKKAWKISANTSQSTLVLRRYLKINNIFYIPNFLRAKK